MLSSTSIHALISVPNDALVCHIQHAKFGLSALVAMHMHGMPSLVGAGRAPKLSQAEQRAQ